MSSLTLEQFRSLSPDDKRKYLEIKKASKQTFYLTRTSKIVTMIIVTILVIVVIAMIFTIITPNQPYFIKVVGSPALPEESCRIDPDGNPNGVAMQLVYNTNPAMAIANTNNIFDGLTPVPGAFYTMTYIVQKRIPVYTYSCLSPTVCNTNMSMLPSMVTSSFPLSSYVWAWYLGVRPTPSGINTSQNVTMYFQNSSNAINNVQPLTVDYGPIFQELGTIDITQFNTYSIQIEYDSNRVVRTVIFGINGTTFLKQSFATRYLRVSPYPMRFVEAVDSSGSDLDDPLALNADYRNFIVLNNKVTDEQLARIQAGENTYDVIDETITPYRYWPLGNNDVSNESFHEGDRNYGCVRGLWVTGSVLVI